MPSKLQFPEDLEKGLSLEEDHAFQKLKHSFHEKPEIRHEVELALSAV
jgi:hypothetical protein